MNTVETDLGREVRKNTKRIVAELTRIHDRYENADWAGIRPADAKIAADTITRLEEERAACTCEAHRPAFEIRPTPAPYLAMEQARVDRMHEADAVVRGML